MGCIVEKSDGTVQLLVHLSLKPGRDDAIIQLLCAAPKGGLAGIVRETMRTGIGERLDGPPQDNDALFELPDPGIDL